MDEGDELVPAVLLTAEKEVIGKDLDPPIVRGSFEEDASGYSQLDVEGDDQSIFSTVTENKKEDEDPIVGTAGAKKKKEKKAK
mmetsp:Transcript_16726/g.26036  ORF Transcript_16726/g.26036 Transcript_16726/m.26036 type:complete len:83 (-) Transcript_16726:236-484(-)